MNNYKKYLIAIILIVTLGFFFVLQKHTPTGANQTQVGQTASTTEEWLTYHNPKYNYRIDYPSDLFVSDEGGDVSFTEGEGGIGDIAVTVEPTSLHTPEEAVTTEFQSANQSTVIDNPISIDGYHGIVVHNIVEGFDHPFPKSILFIKDGFLFRIADRTDGYQHTWNSFHFEE